MKSSGQTQAADRQLGVAASRPSRSPAPGRSPARPGPAGWRRGRSRAAARTRRRRGAARSRRRARPPAAAIASPPGRAHCCRAPPQAVPRFDPTCAGRGRRQRRRRGRRSAPGSRAAALGRLEPPGLVHRLARRPPPARAGSGARRSPSGSKRWAWRSGLKTRLGRVSLPVPGDPLPVAGVVGDLAVAEQVPEMPGAPAPVEVEVLGQEGGDDHPRPVVHAPLAPQLAHRRVDDRVAGAPLLPGLEGAARARPAVAAGPVVAARQGRVGGKHLVVEVAPAELAHVGAAAAAAQRASPSSSSGEMQPKRR